MQKSAEALMIMVMVTVIIAAMITRTTEYYGQ